MANPEPALLSTETLNRIHGNSLVRTATVRGHATCEASWPGTRDTAMHAPDKMAMQRKFSSCCPSSNQSSCKSKCLGNPGEIQHRLKLNGRGRVSRLAQCSSAHACRSNVQHALADPLMAGVGGTWGRQLFFAFLPPYFRLYILPSPISNVGDTQCGKHSAALCTRDNQRRTCCRRPSQLLVCAASLLPPAF